MSESGLLVLVLAIPVALGLVPAAIAYQKGRSFLGWWVFGTLLFVPALICAILIGPTAEVSDTRDRRGGLRPCPFCAEYIRSEAIVCRYCGREVTLSRRLVASGNEPEDLHRLVARLGESDIHTLRLLADQPEGDEDAWNAVLNEARAQAVDVVFDQAWEAVWAAGERAGRRLSQEDIERAAGIAARGLVAFAVREDVDPDYLEEFVKPIAAALQLSLPPRPRPASGDEGETDEEPTAEFLDAVSVLSASECCQLARYADDHPESEREAAWSRVMTAAAELQVDHIFDAAWEAVVDRAESHGLTEPVTEQTAEVVARAAVATAVKSQVDSDDFKLVFDPWQRVCPHLYD